MSNIFSETTTGASATGSLLSFFSFSAAVCGRFFWNDFDGDGLCTDVIGTRVLVPRNIPWKGRLLFLLFRKFSFTPILNFASRGVFHNAEK